jgi:hypothetical protein
MALLPLVMIYLIKIIFKILILTFKQAMKFHTLIVDSRSVGPDAGASE